MPKPVAGTVFGVVEERQIEVPDELARPVERERVHAHGPEHADQPQAEEVLHEHGEHVLGPDHAAVEQGQPRRHEHDERGAHEHPGGVARVDPHGSPPPDPRLGGAAGRSRSGSIQRCHWREPDVTRIVQEPPDAKGAGLGHAPDEVQRRQIVVAEVAEGADDQPVPIVGPGPLVEGVAGDRRYPGRQQDRGRLAVRARVRPRAGSRPAGPSRRRTTRRNSATIRAVAAMPASTDASSARGAHVGVDLSPRVEDPYHRTLDPAGELTLDTGDDRGPGLSHRGEAARSVVGKLGHPSMTSPSMVFTVQPTPSR